MGILIHCWRGLW